MWPGDLAPNDPDLGSPLLGLGLVDVCDLLAKVEVGSRGVVNTLDLDQAGLGTDDVATALVAQVATLHI